MLSLIVSLSLSVSLTQIAVKAIEYECDSDKFVDIYGTFNTDQSHQIQNTIITHKSGGLQLYLETGHGEDSRDYISPISLQIKTFDGGDTLVSDQAEMDTWKVKGAISYPRTLDAAKYNIIIDVDNSITGPYTLRFRCIGLSTTAPTTWQTISPTTAPTIEATREPSAALSVAKRFFNFVLPTLISTPTASPNPAPTTGRPIPNCDPEGLQTGKKCSKNSDCSYSSWGKDIVTFGMCAFLPEGKKSANDLVLLRNAETCDPNCGCHCERVHLPIDGFL